IRQDQAGRSYVHHCGTVKGFNACLILYVNEKLVVATADNAASLGLWPGLALADIFRRTAAGATERPVGATSTQTQSQQ
ncbi:MAG: hypothetical protein P8Y93_14935, partial [Acidobacteriota bacterium]